MALPAIGAAIAIARGASYLKKLNNLRKLKKAQQAGKAFEAKLKNSYIPPNPTLREPTSKLGTIFKAAAANTAAESTFDVDVLPGFDDLFKSTEAQAPGNNPPKSVLNNEILKRKYKSSKP